MTSYQRTQMYLDPDDHRRLKRLAAERNQSMTDLVREAVARYIAEESSEDLPSVQEMMAELSADPLYEDLPAGSEGFVARMGARAAADVGAPAALHPVDRDLGEALLAEHDEHVRTWVGRRGTDHRRPNGEPR